MKKLSFGRGFFIKAKRRYKLPELFEVLQGNLSEKYGAMAIKKLLCFRWIEVQCVDRYVCHVGVSGKGVTIFLLKRQNVFEYLFNRITRDTFVIIAMVLNLYGTPGSKAMAKTFAEDVDKLIA